MYHHNYWYGGWSSTWFKSGGTFCHHFAVLVAFSATTFPFWWHFPPPWLFSRLSEWWRFLPSLCCFDGAFCRHFAVLTALFAPTFAFWRHFLPPHFFGSDLCGGAFCPHFVVLGALSAPICTFWGRFLPPLAGFTYSVVSFTITSASNITFSAISAPSSDNSFVSGGISTSSCSLITESPTAAS